MGANNSTHDQNNTTKSKINYESQNNAKVCLDCKPTDKKNSTDSDEQHWSGCSNEYDKLDGIIYNILKARLNYLFYI